MPRGRPYFPRCAKCAKRLWPAGKEGGYDLTRTGRERDRDGILYREVHCATCGQLGWSKHSRVESLATPARS